MKCHTFYVAAAAWSATIGKQKSMQAVDLN